MKHILCIGAHPDDNEFSVGGTAAKWAARGDAVHFVSVTNGDKGHFAAKYIAAPHRLAERRLVEARFAASLIGASYQTLGIHDGELYVGPEASEAMIRCIRSCGEPGRGPDLVVFNRPQDYHRDHRYASQTVIDATYMLTVPMICSDVRHLDRMPVFAYWYDDFRDVVPFRPDVVVPIDEVMEQKVAMVCAHESQVFEWLPYNGGKLDEVPHASDAAARKRMINAVLVGRDGGRLQRLCTVNPGLKNISAKCVEAFQMCEYGLRPDATDLSDLFPV